MSRNIPSTKPPTFVDTPTTVSRDDFVSGGRNPNWQNTCYDCVHLKQGERLTGGWCEHPANRTEPSPGWPEGFTPAVSWTGGCGLWRSRDTPATHHNRCTTPEKHPESITSDREGET